MKPLTFFGSMSVVLGLLACANVQAQDSVQSQMNSMFNTMSNVTKPSVSMDARRGVISGGSIEIRNQVMHPNLISFNPPSIGAGCSGIDAQLGSLSFISKQQFTQALKSIAAGAVGYAFELALGDMCQDCRNVMDQLKNKIDQVNGMVKNSCAISEAAVNGAASLFGNSYGQQTLVANGTASDSAAASQTTPSQGSIAQVAAQSSPAAMAAAMPGNIVWTGLNKTSAMSWWPGGNTQLAEVIMSMTGSVVSCIQAADATCASGGQSTSGAAPSGVVTYNIPPLMSLGDLLEGTSGGAPQYYNCSGSCLSPSQSAATFQGMRSVVHQMLFGTDGVSGLVGDLTTDPDAQMSSQDQAFLGALGADGQILASVARVNPSGAKTFASQIEDSVALDLSFSLADQMLKTALYATSTMQTPGASDAYKLVESRRKDLSAEYQQLKGQFGTNYQNLALGEKLIEFYNSSPSQHGVSSGGAASAN
ncbi:MAG: conjugal transfer protein TraH [Rhodanobacter sp.]